ncbi:MAG: F0F1 ATP synthase subunit B [Bryobacterales bacterium]|nr:F0F1 ATP synthase subunit B [Bryobacterales bacterium]
MAGDSGNALLQFEPGLMIWTVVTFLVTFLALRLIAWKPILGVLDEREGRIRDSLAKAEQAQAESERAIAENKANMQASLRQSQALVAEAKQEAERVREQAREEARAEARKIMEDGRRQLETERRAALADLRQEAAGLAIKAAEQLLRKNLGDEENRQLVRSFLDQLSKPPVH